MCITCLPSVLQGHTARLQPPYRSCKAPRAQVLTWNSHHIDKRIAETLALVREAADALAAIQANARRTRELAAQWAARLLFERKDGKARARTLAPHANPTQTLHSLCCAASDKMSSRIGHGYYPTLKP